MSAADVIGKLVFINKWHCNCMLRLSAGDIIYKVALQLHAETMSVGDIIFKVALQLHAETMSAGDIIFKVALQLHAETMSAGDIIYKLIFINWCTGIIYYSNRLYIK